jgi:hypothetical protein
MTMRIVDAVRRAIEEDAQEFWSIYTRAGCAHHFHVSVRCAPDGYDAEIMRRLARGEQSTRAGVMHIERADGTLRPTLIPEPFRGFDRRSGPRLGAEFRKERIERLEVPESA